MNYDEKKLKRLNSILQSMGNIMVAFSGGVDSSFLLCAAGRITGCNVTAVTIRTPYIPKWEIDEAKAFAEHYGINHSLLNLDMPQNIIHNPQERCYLCKTILFSELRKLADKNNAVLVDGSNFDDISDYRPGLRALKELDVRSPLMEAELTKTDIRAISEEWNLPTYNKPAYACLLTRIPFGTEITPEILHRIEIAETALINIGFPAVRVRHHDDLARVELPPEDIARAIKYREKVADILKKSGYRFAALDLDGYRMGSLNPQK